VTEGVQQDNPLTHTILCVDDEENILASLQRLFRKIDCKVLTATSAEKALTMLKDQPVTMVISDERMPNMKGSEFLSLAKELAPASIRILLTGYADVTSAITAVNQGGLFRYVTKPWDDNDLLTTVRAGLSQYELIDRNRRLEEQTRRQNEELAVLNQTLEQRVTERTKALEAHNEELQKLYELLEKDLFESLEMVLAVMEAYSPRLVGHSRRVAAHVEGLAPFLGLVEYDAKIIVTAALLHDLGLIGIPHEILDKPDPLLNAAERALLQEHTRLGMETVTALSRLKMEGPIILSHHERYDGQGYPSKLKGAEIPLGARIIAVVEGYDHVLAPSYGTPIPALENDAIEHVKAEQGKAYDPKVVESFLRMLSGSCREARSVTLKDLGEGMMLATNLSTPQGVLLAPKGTILTRPMIKRLQQLPPDKMPAHLEIIPKN
jgi:response regulator RpfG family c-di-GMP phosphodiesterase